MNDTNGQIAASESYAIEGAINDAQRLLAYAAAAGIQISSDVTRIIVASTALQTQKTDDPSTFEQQAKFWDAYYALVRNVQPVSAASLRASTRKIRDNSVSAWISVRILRRAPEKVTAPEVAVRLFRRWAMAALISLLVVQVYWVIGNTVVGQIAPIITKVQELNENNNELRRKTQNAADVPEIQVNDAKILALSTDMEIRLEVLKQWNALWSMEAFKKSDKKTSSSQKGAYEKLRSEMLYATFAMSALQIYVLPLLYGLLGACLFILRNLAKDLKSLTYNDDLTIQYRLRLYMGSLAGLVFVWFLPAAEKVGPLSSLTSFAVAFLAGYSVELLFAFLDKIIAAFTAK